MLGFARLSRPSRRPAGPAPIAKALADPWPPLISPAIPTPPSGADRLSGEARRPVADAAATSPVCSATVGPRAGLRDHSHRDGQELRSGRVRRPPVAEEGNLAYVSPVTRLAFGYTLRGPDHLVVAELPRPARLRQMDSPNGRCRPRLRAALAAGAVEIDYAAQKISRSDTQTLHCVDPRRSGMGTVSQDLFLDGESPKAETPPTTAVGLRVFDPSIRGRTDQVVSRFRKPSAENRRCGRSGWSGLLSSASPTEDSLRDLGRRRGRSSRLPLAGQRSGRGGGCSPAGAGSAPGRRRPGGRRATPGVGSGSPAAGAGPERWRASPRLSEAAPAGTRGRGRGPGACCAWPSSSPWRVAGGGVVHLAVARRAYRSWEETAVARVGRTHRVSVRATPVQRAAAVVQATMAGATLPIRIQAR